MAMPTYLASASEAAFLLGGIGTGNISVGARGELRDWEIFNSPNKGFYSPGTYFALWCRSEGQAAVAKILESRIRPPYRGQSGIRNRQAGVGRFANSQMRAEYPFVWVDLMDPAVPVAVTLEAFTPFIPLNADDSGIPAAVIRYRVANPTGEPVEVAVAGTLANLASFTGFNGIGKRQFADDAVNEYRNGPGASGYFLRTSSLSPSDAKFGNLAIMVTDLAARNRPNAWSLLSSSPRPSGNGGGDFWNDFREDGRLNEAPRDGDTSLVERPRLGFGHVGGGDLLAPGESRVFEFIVSWYYPNRPKCWNAGAPDQQCCDDTVRNYYATKFKDAWDVGSYLVSSLDRLEQQSRDFHRAFFTTTMPLEVLDAASTNITVLRSPTCFRLEDGTFAGWEGCNDEKGCCAGSCTHVWNYAQTVAFLFPELEHSMRQVEFNQETDEAGNMSFRANSVFELPRWEFHPAADGQMGTIVRLYRDWKYSGNDELIKSVWTGAARALDFAFTYWDADGDLVLDSQQHNTYDIEFYGPNSLSNSMFYAALAAASEIAAYLGDDVRAVKYKDALVNGSARMDEMLWGGEFYVQQLEDIDEHPHQYGAGCLSDQVFGQSLAHVAGLGYVLPEDHVKRAVRSIAKYNFRSDFLDGESMSGRIYALNDESGLLLCTWPNGGRPKKPFFYSDEVWPGIEYQVAAHLIYEGFVDEGLRVVRGVRDRHDGVRRSPWNECECGHHYVRSMASWALILALSGYSYDLVGSEAPATGEPRRQTGRPFISFDPKINADDFSTFFSTAHCWGIYTQRRNKDGEMEPSVEVLYGELGDTRLSPIGRRAQ